MESKIYAIQKLFAVSFTIDVFLLCVLFVFSFFIEGSSLEQIILGIFLIPALFVLCELWSRKVVLDAHGVRLEKFLRKQDLSWHEISSVGVLVLSSRSYLLLTTPKGLISISNAYDHFQNLLRDIADHVDREKVDEEVRRLINSPQAGRSALIKFWIAALIMLALIIFKLFY